MTATREQITEFFAEGFPQAAKCTIDFVDETEAVVRHHIGFDELRPGGTVSGPAMMAVTDYALYVAIFGHYGLLPIAVTTSLNFNFMRKPAADKDIVARCRLLKTGKSLAVGEVWLYSEGSEDKTVAHAVGTYAIPPER